MLHTDRYSKPCFRVHGAHSVRNKLLREASICVFISIFISFMASKCYMYNNAAYNLFLGFLISPKQLQGELLELSRFCSFSYTSKFSSNLAFKILSSSVAWSQWHELVLFCIIVRTGHSQCEICFFSSFWGISIGRFLFYFSNV